MSAVVTSRPRLRNAAALEHIADVGRALFVKHLGLSDDDAVKVSRLCAHEIARKFGGVQYYIPKTLDLSAGCCEDLEVTPKWRRRARKLLEGVAHAARTLLVQHLGVSENKAAKVADQFAHEVGSMVSGHLFYLPLGKALSLRNRDEEIAAAFTGNNYRELALLFGLSFTSIYRIVAHFQQEKHDRRPVRWRGAQVSHAAR